MNITFNLDRVARRVEISSTPFMSGIMRSVSTRSGRMARTLPKASLALVNSRIS